MDKIEILGIYIFNFTHNQLFDYIYCLTYATMFCPVRIPTMCHFPSGTRISSEMTISFPKIPKLAGGHCLTLSLTLFGCVCRCIFIHHVTRVIRKVCATFIWNSKKSVVELVKIIKISVHYRRWIKNNMLLRLPLQHWNRKFIPQYL